MKAQIVKTIYIEAARRIDPSHTGDTNYTGNSYRIDLFAEGEIDASIGWVIDYADMKHLFEPVRRQLDHCCLSDIPSLKEDTSPEAIEAWIREKLRPWPAWFAGVRVSLPVPQGFSHVWLVPCEGLGLPERLAFSFSAAQSLPQLPKGHPCRELHGHTYQVEIAAKNHEGMEAACAEVFSRLDNTYLNCLPGLEQATAERIAAWIWKFLMEKKIAPKVVAVQETPNNRCHYRGE
ncbi:MAG: 6-carboxytetrahydropterin synthase [Candidatus Hydrogenedentes bacterium]|nr:6-carboxytetrahydropterin synthase [Candidatus Hydrogenedentota bacterium]